MLGAGAGVSVSLIAADDEGAVLITAGTLLLLVPGHSATNQTNYTFLISPTVSWCGPASRAVLSQDARWIYCPACFDSKVVILGRF